MSQAKRLAWIEELAKRAPALGVIADKHIAGDDVRHHEFMRDAAEYVTQAFAPDANLESRADGSAVLEALESAGQSMEFLEIAKMSFLANINFESKAGREVRESFGPVLLEAAKSAGDSATTPSPKPGVGSFVWGAVMALIGVSVVLWIVYAGIFGQEDTGYPLWWGLILLVFWSYVIVKGGKKMRAALRSSN